MPQLRSKNASTTKTEGKSTSGDSHETIKACLTVTQGLVTTVEAIIPSEVGQGVFSIAGAILSLIQTTLKNKDDFRGLVARLQEIIEVAERIKELDNDQLGDPVRSRMMALRLSLEKIKADVEHRMKRPFFKSFPMSSTDRDQISGWQTELSDLLRPVSLHLQMSLHSKTAQIHAKVQEISDQQRQILKETKMVPPPSRPPIFFGRDALVADVTVTVLSGRPVVLVGPGGIGKTSVAKVVLNEQAIEAKFCHRRFFVRCDDVDSSQASLSVFFNCLVAATGLDPESTNVYASIAAFLSTDDALLVIDNAETFLDDPNNKDRISDIIDDIGAIPSVTVVMTSRSRELPPNLAWEIVSVPPLEEASALETFTAIYRQSPSGNLLDTLKGLLSELGYDPISVNVLAQVAVQNRWSIDVLQMRWRDQRMQLLRIGSSKSKTRNLAVLIELALTSPVIAELGEAALDVLRIIAFLPQGLRASSADHVFANELETDRRLDTFIRHSLVYREGEFINMLPPIRAYLAPQTILSGTVSRYFPFLVDYFCISCMSCCTGMGRDGIQLEERRQFIRQEDLNAEKTILTVLPWFREGNPDCYRSIASTCLFFWTALARFKPRVTAITEEMLVPPPLIVQQDESGYVLPTYGGALLHLGCLYHVIGRSKRAGSVLSKVIAVWERVDLPDALEVHMKALIFSAYSWENLGHFKEAEALLRKVLSLPPSPLGWDVWCMYVKARTHLARMLLIRGRAEDCAKMLDGTNIMLYNSTYELYVDFAIASGELCVECGLHHEASQFYLAAIIGLHETIPERRVRVAEAAAELMLLLRELDRASKIVSICRELPKDLWTGHACWFACRAAVLAAIGGQFELATQELQTAKRHLTESEAQDSIACEVPYACGQVALYQNHLAASREPFAAAAKDATQFGSLRFRALAARALGELLFVEGDVKKAVGQWDVARTFCGEMGIKTDRLYKIDRGGIFHRLPEKFSGWEAYLRGEVDEHTELDDGSMASAPPVRALLTSTPHGSS